MCLDVYDDCDIQTLDSGDRTARKSHRCDECGREITPGERYHFWVDICDGDLRHQKMCAHCFGTLELGCAISGCPRYWFWTMMHNTSPDDGGFVGDIIANHPLTRAQTISMLRTVVGRRHDWRRKDGTLLPIPVAS